MISPLSILNPGYLYMPLANLISSFDWSNIIDYSGNGKHLTLGGQSPPVVVQNAFGAGINGLQFAGISNAVAEGEKFDITATNYTIEFRIKRNTSKNGTTQVLFGRWATGGTTQQWLCFFDTANKLNFINNSGQTATTTSTIIDANPHAIAVVKTGTNVKIFVDGVQAFTGTTGGTPTVVANDVPFRLGSHDDNTGGYLPFWGIIGDLRWSNIARYSTNYTPSTSNLTTDANTLALIKMDALKGTYLDTPVFQSNILLRTGYTQASGGWANPDGYLDTLDGKKFFTASAYDGTKWTVWAFIGNTINSTFAIQSVAIQTPVGATEGDLAGNGSVVAFNGKYWHYYMDNRSGNRIRVSSANTLNEAFPQGAIIFDVNTGGYSSYIDPMVRPITGGLEMFLCGDNSGVRTILRSTSADGTTWTTPVSLGSARMTFNTFYQGEPDILQLGNSIYIITGDGAPTSTTAREVVRWVSKDGLRTLPLLKFFGTTQSGYLGCYDASITYDAANSRLIFLCTHSQNTAQTQPTNSDIGVWYVPIINGG